MQERTTTAATTAKPRMRFLGGSLYLVESSSRPGVGHKVDVLRLKCGCEAGQHNRRCHHLVWAIQMDAWRRGAQAQAMAPAAPIAAPASRVPFREAGPKTLAECFA